MADLTRKLQAKNVKEGLGDTEVAKAILKIMVKSKKWQDHKKNLANCQRVITDKSSDHRHQ